MEALQALVTRLAQLGAQLVFPIGALVLTWNCLKALLEGGTGRALKVLIRDAVALLIVVQLAAHPNEVFSAISPVAWMVVSAVLDALRSAAQ